MMMLKLTAAGLAALTLSVSGFTTAHANQWQSCRVFAEEECATQISPGSPTWETCVAFFTQLCLNDLHAAPGLPVADVTRSRLCNAII